MDREKTRQPDSDPVKDGAVSSQTHDPASHKAPNVTVPNVGRETDPTWSPQNPGDVQGDRGKDK